MHEEEEINEEGHFDEEDEEEIEEDLDETLDLVKCMMQHVLNVAQDVKCLSSLPKESPCIAGNVTRSENHDFNSSEGF